MTRIAIVIAAAVAFTATLPIVPAQAQRARVFVASYGVDGNPCTFGSPCKTFQYAVGVVADQGEVTAIDSAGFGTVTITNKSVTITSPDGVEAGIAIPSGGTGIMVNGGTSDLITLRGLVLDGAGVGLDGIEFNSGKSLTVENCVVRNMTRNGLQLVSNATTTQTLSVSNSYFNDNGLDGIFIQTSSSGTVTAAIDRTTFDGNSTNGLFVYGAGGTGAISVAVTDSVAANSAFGFAVESTTSSSVSNLSLTHSLAVGNNTGVLAQGTNATLWLAQSTVTGSMTLFNALSGGAILSYGDNYLAAANGPPVGTLTGASTQ